MSEREVEFRLEKYTDSTSTVLTMNTSIAVAVSVMGAGICDLANHVRESEGEEAYMAFLGMVGEVFSSKNLWEIMNGAEKGLLAKIVDKIFH